MSNFRNHPLWQISKTLAMDPARRMAVKTVHGRKIPLSWCEGRNWGDALSPWLVQQLSGKVPIHLKGLHHDRYMVIGSILGGANERAEVWGSGFIREDEGLIGKPRAVHAVRGPLSREKLLRFGVDCPEVYGDPALLLPWFFNPQVEKTHAVGIIPHYIDKAHPWVKDQSRDPQVRILDIESGIEEFVIGVKSCEVILSSSLHGLICADSYGIPNAWILLSDEVMGGDFKFRDYRASIGAGVPSALRICADTQLADAVIRVERHEMHVDQRMLILACPFLSKTLRQEVVSSKFKDGGLGNPFKLPNAARLYKSKWLKFSLK